MIQNEFLLQPNIYNTQGRKTLLSLLEEHWITNIVPGQGDIYIMSGFGNYNGGVRFYDIFKKHTQLGGKIFVVLGGSTSQRMASKQVVEKLLDSGATVTILNRKKIMHAKLYGYKNGDSQSLIVTSGNFTGPGMSQNVEAALGLSPAMVQSVGFDWEEFYNAFIAQSWDIHIPLLPINDQLPEWKLLYDENVRPVSQAIELEEKTLVMTLSHADTARINAQPGTAAGKGSQYFWLTKDAVDFFPALTIPNVRGSKPTYSTLIYINYIDLNITRVESRVTYEAGNNVDFRLGTGPLRYTGIAEEGDLLAFTRRAYDKYDLKIIKNNTPEYNELVRFAINYIGNQGKKYGYIQNDMYERIISGSNV